MGISRRHLLSATAGSMLFGARPAIAQSESLELARIIIGFPTGGTVDAVSRLVAERLRGTYARTVIVEPRVGASGQLAVQAMKGAPTDGSTILLCPMATLGVFPHTYKRLPYDAMTDLAPVCNAVTYYYALAVGPAVPASVTTVPQFIEWCRGNPAKASFGSGATGSPLHFTGILLGRANGVELTHVGYRGTGSMLTDLMGGTLPACVSPVGDVLPHLGSGRLRVLGTSGASRNRFMPTVPTFLEAGYKGLAFDQWWGFFLPARAKPEMVTRLNTELVAALNRRDVQNSLNAIGMEATPSTPAELGALLKSDTERWGEVVRSVGFTADS